MGRSVAEAPGPYWEAKVGSVSVWFGLASDRWMLGVVLNPRARCLGFGIGPVYFGAGT